jgi:hypothetical protein
MQYLALISKDATDLVRTCDVCQRFACITKNPPEYLHSITSPWPFAK